MLQDREVSPQCHRIHLEVTQKCQYSCKHCYVEASRERVHHSLDLLRKVLSKLELAGAERLALTGGEFFLHPHWKEILTSTRIPNIYILTNGMAIHPGDLNWINQYRLQRMQREKRAVVVGFGISLDGLEGHRHQRGYDDKDVLHTIDTFIEAGFFVTVNTVITNDMIAREVPQLFKVLIDRKIHRWQIGLGRPIGRYLRSGLLLHKLEHLDTAKKSLKDVIARYLQVGPPYPLRLEIEQMFRSGLLSSGKFVEHRLDEHPCAYEQGAAIVENGDEYRYCALLRNVSFGKLGENDLVTLRRDAVYRDFVKLRISDTDCADCRYVRVCGGGCRASALAWTNDLLKKDPVCCEFSPFVESEIVPLLPKKLQYSFHSLLYHDRPRPCDKES